MKSLIHSLVPLFLIACGVDEVRLGEREQEVDDGDAKNDPGQPLDAADPETHCGFDDPLDGGAVDCPDEDIGVGGHGTTLLRRGGFEGERTAEFEAPGIDTQCYGNSVAVYDIANCRAGSLCSNDCETSQECGFSPENAAELRGKCIHRGDESRCTLPCKNDTDCIEGMHCAETDFGRSCLLTETPWTAECADDFTDPAVPGGAAGL